MFSLPSATFYKKSPRRNPTMTSAPNHHGSTRAHIVMAPNSIEPTSTNNPSTRRMLRIGSPPASTIRCALTNTMA